LGRRAQLSPGVGGASAAEQEGREKGTRVEAGEPPPFSPLSLSLYAGRAATGWRPARWFNRGREATRNETNGDDKTNEKHRDFKKKQLHITASINRSHYSVSVFTPEIFGIPQILGDGRTAGSSGQGRAPHVAGTTGPNDVGVLYTLVYFFQIPVAFLFSRASGPNVFFLSSREVQ
jgi:hypothetical protein